MKYTVITGASSGIGYETAKAFAGRGKNLILAARRKDLLEQLRAEILVSCPETDVIIKDTDLSVLKNVHQFYESLKGYPLETWINNAGIGHMGLFQLTKTDFLKNLYHVNVFAPMILTQLILRIMTRQKYGRIINIASTAASEIYEGNSIYGSSKAALIAFTQSLAAETYKYGVTVNAIAPGLIDTDMSSIFEGKDPEEPIRHTALGRKIEPDEIAKVIILLLSDDMNIMNGAVVTLNGGHK